MAREYKTILEFKDCPFDEATEKLFTSIAKSMDDERAPYSGSFEMEFEFKRGMPSLTEKKTKGLTDAHLKMLSEFEATGLKALSRGKDGAKIKTEAEINKI